jgi:hypothetical protein
MLGGPQNESEHDLWTGLPSSLLKFSHPSKFKQPNKKGNYKLT